MNASSRALIAACSATVVALAAPWASTAGSTRDSDRDGVKDGREQARNCSPHRKDTDRDGMRDRFEVRYKLRCQDRRDAHDDPDRDGLSNLREFRRGTNPRRSNVPDLGDDAPLPDLPQPGFVRSDRFNTAVPNQGRRSYENDRDQAAFVVAGRFSEATADAGVATIGPDVVRVWMPGAPGADCFLDAGGARSWFTPRGDGTGLLQPCSGNATSDPRYTALRRDGLFNDPSAAVATAPQGAGGQNLLVADLGDDRVVDARVSAEQHGDGRRTGRIVLLSGIAGGAPSVRTLTDAIPGPMALAASADSQIAVVSSECVGGDCHNQHFPDDVWQLPAGGGTPQNLGWSAAVNAYNATVGRGTVVCSGKVVWADVNGTGPLDLVRWGPVCPQTWTQEGTGANGSGIEFRLDGRNEVVGITTTADLTGVAFANVDGRPGNDIVVTTPTSYAVGTWEDATQTTGHPWVVAPYTESQPVKAVPGLHYDFDDGRTPSRPQFGSFFPSQDSGFYASTLELADLTGIRPGEPLDGRPDMLLGGSRPAVMANQGPQAPPAVQIVAPSVETGADIPQKWQTVAGDESTTQTATGSIPPNSQVSQGPQLARVLAGPGAGQFSVFTRGKIVCYPSSYGCISAETHEDAVEVFSHTQAGNVALAVPTGSQAVTGETVRLTAAYTPGATIRRATWNFADGSTETRSYPEGTQQATIEHAYTTPGVYQPKVTLTNVGGNRSEQLLDLPAAVVVRSPVTVSLAGNPKVVVEPGGAVTLSAKPVGGFPRAGATPYVLQWTRDGADWAGPPAGGRVVLDAGRHEITVTAADSRTTSAPARVLVRVAPQPVARFGAVAGRHPVQGYPVSFDASASTGGIGPLTYAWDLDGQPGYERSTGATPTVDVTFGEAGPRPVGLQVTEADAQFGDQVAVDRETLDVRGPIRPVVTVTAVSEGFPKTVRFDAAQTSGGVPPYTYAWQVDGVVDPGATGRSYSRTFAAPGRHTVEAVVTDAEGNSAGMLDPEPRVVDVAETLSADLTYTASPAHPEAGEPVTLTADTPAGANLDYAWDVEGDGTYVAGSRSRGATFKAAAVYRVHLRATDPAGVVSEGRGYLEVVPELTTNPTHDPLVPAPGEEVVVDADARGGFGALAFAWDPTGEGPFPAATVPDETRTLDLGGRGAHEVAVRVTDRAGHSDVGRQTIFVADPLVLALAVTPAGAETGETLTFDASGTKGGVGSLTYEFDVDGRPGYEIPADRRAVYSTRVDVPVNESIGVRVSDEAGQRKALRMPLVVNQRLAAALADPGALFDGVPKLLDARGTSAGTPPYDFRWDVDGKPGYEVDTGETPTLRTTFAAPGSVAIGVQVTDANSRTDAARRDVVVASGCMNKVVSGLATVTTEGTTCLRDVSVGDTTQFASDGDVRINGLLLDVAAGAKVNVYPTEPGSTERGRLTTTGPAVVEVDGVPVIDATLDWFLPADDPSVAAEEVAMGGIPLPEAAVKLLGLKLQGRIGWALGVEADGTPYTRFRGGLVIPGVNAGEDGVGVTARVNLRVDAQGTQTDGVYAQVENAHLGKSLAIENLCLSYVAAGQTDSDSPHCATFDGADGQAFLACNRDSNTDRWDGTAELKLPVGPDELKMSAGLADGQLSHLEADVTFGRKFPLYEDVWLNHVAVGVCITPKPLKIKGAAGIHAIARGQDDEAVKVEGEFTYTDTYTDAAGTTTPWLLEMKGSVDLFDHPAVSGNFTLDGDATAGFALQSRYQFPSGSTNLASIEGGVSGWLNFGSGRFNVEGDVEACVVSVICAGGEALISSNGVSGCVTIIPAIDFGPFGSSPEVRTGFGYFWGGSFSLMGPSCDIGSWRAMRPGTRAGGGYAFTVPEGELVQTLRFSGAGGSPDVVVRGPNGETIEMSELQQATGAFGEHLMIKNPTDGTTIVQLVRPTPGRWTVEPKGMSVITKHESAETMERPVVHARVTGSGPRRTLHYSYTDQARLAVVFGEVAHTGGEVDVQRRIGRAPVARETECGKGRRCGSIPFRPAHGEAGRRSIVAAITRAGAPVDNPIVGSYVAPAPRKPGAVSAVRISRERGGVNAVWARAPRAAHYSVVATEVIRRGKKLVPGYSVVHPEATRCLALPPAPRGSGVRLQITPVDANGERGATFVQRLRIGAARVGPRGGLGAQSGGPRSDSIDGTRRDDVISGRAGADRIRGAGRGDCVIAGEGADRVTGDDGDDTLEGGRGDDVLFGGDGHDDLEGGAGDDELHGGDDGDTLAGGAGDDTLVSGAGSGALNGGSGRDRIRAANGQREIVLCGPGRDDAVVDRIDVVRACEKVRRAG